MEPEIVVQWLADILRMVHVSDSYVSPEVDSPETFFEFLSRLRIFRDSSNFKLGHVNFISNSLFNNHFIIVCYIIWATESAIR
jgi:hypothetical protein